MKLFDLLKSLNSGAPVNPDAPSSARENDRTQLLNELSSLLKLLDAPEAKSTTIEPAINVDNTAATSSLNLDTIFEGMVHEESDDANCVVLSPRTDSPRQTTSALAIDLQPQTHQQLVRSLLDELLPMLEKALGDRFDQLDNDTLEQWAKATSNITPPTSI